MTELFNLAEWQALQDHHHDLQHQHMRDWFVKDTNRFERYSLTLEGLLLDYCRNRITDQTLSLLIKLANAQGLTEKIHQLFAGAPINHTEKRPALHTLLRDTQPLSMRIDEIDIGKSIQATQQRIVNFVNSVHQQTWRGVTGKPIKTVVNIGIGGSYIGPMMCSDALKDFAVSDINLHFVSTVDKIPLQEVLQQIDPETTLFILSSKSFTTIETLTNANTFLNWMHNKLGDGVLSKHFVAVTAKPEKALAYGIPKENIFAIWDWVGGRYSVWSAIALPLILLIGNANFAAFLQGAHIMDEHFRRTPYQQNLPVILALLSIWYTNFFNARAHAIVPYAHRLRYLIPYLQQVEMESNGKHIRHNGDAIPYVTSPVIFGEEGCRGQHAYHQLLHQGQHLIPVDFILANNAERNTHDDILMASALSQAEALMRGKTYHEAYQALLKAKYDEQEAQQLAQHQVIPGNRPCNIIFLDRITPKNLGMLLALYEHRIFVQGAIWDINSFDQWGVELGKQLLPAILQAMQNDKNVAQLDKAMTGLLHHVRKK